MSTTPITNLTSAKMERARVSITGKVPFPNKPFPFQLTHNTNTLLQA